MLMACDQAITFLYLNFEKITKNKFWFSKVSSTKACWFFVAFYDTNWEKNIYLLSPYLLWHTLLRKGVQRPHLSPKTTRLRKSPRRFKQAEKQWQSCVRQRLCISLYLLGELIEYIPKLLLIFLSFKIMQQFFYSPPSSGISFLCQDFWHGDVTPHLAQPCNLALRLALYSGLMQLLFFDNFKMKTYPVLLSWNILQTGLVL